MKRPPKPRKAVFDQYWRLAFERQAIFERRTAGEPAPWTDDPILQTYKFCNTYRVLDRETQHLLRETACNKACEGTDDQLFQIVAYRFFSKIETWRGLIDELGAAPRIDDLKNGRFLQAVEATKRKNEKLYTNAFILCANKAFGHDQKHRNHVELFKRMFVQGKLAKKLRKAASLKEIYGLLQEYPLMGGFMSYQVAVDLNYSSQINFDENDFCRAGPGALRGIRKAFEDAGDFAPEEIIHWMVDRQTAEFERLELPFRGLHGRPLHAIDAQGLFCELDKYSRVAFPQLKSVRVRIKTRFEPTKARLTPIFPPKWGLKPT